MNCDRYSLVILGIIFSIPMTANIADSKEPSNPPETTSPCLMAKVLSTGLRDTPQSSLGELLGDRENFNEDAALTKLMYSLDSGTFKPIAPNRVAKNILSPPTPNPQHPSPWLHSKDKKNIKISGKLNLDQPAEIFNLLTVDQFDQNAIAKLITPDYKQPQKIVKSDTKISTSAADIQNKSHLSHQSGVFNSPQLDPSQLKFALAAKPVIGKSDQNIFSDSTKFPPIHNLLIADKNHSGKPGKWSGARPDGHAPIGVMGEHTHGKGEFMFSYRYMLMSMNGNRDGTDNLSDSEVLQQFMVTPTEMTMEMHMFGAMYAPSDNLTLMAMVPYVVKEMDHTTRSGVRFTTNSEGFGDIQTSGLYKIFDKNNQRIHLNLGFSFPTGSINQRDDTPAGNNQILPYPMQIGSGTFDLLPGITYLGQSKQNSWGAQAMGTLRLGENSNGYRLGNQLQLTGWVARNWNEWLSTSLRLKGRTWGNINGADDRLNPNMIPTADPDRRAGTQLDIGFGVNLYAPQGDLKGGRLAVEFELPLYRSLDGPQLETDWQLTLGLQAAF